MACYPGCNCYYCNFSPTAPSPVTTSTHLGPGYSWSLTATGWKDPDCCLDCGRELSKTLDAYYGKDPNDAKRCVKCRG